MSPTVVAVYAVVWGSAVAVWSVVAWQEFASRSTRPHRPRTAPENA